MNRQDIRNAQGRLLGWLQTDPTTGQVFAHKAGGNILGYFIPTAGPDGRTYDNRGQALGNGNQLIGLFY